MADEKTQASAQAQRPMFGPGGPGGRGGPGGMNARIMREKPKDVRGTVRKLMKYLGHSRYLMLLLLLAVLASTALNLAAPALQGKAIDAIALDPENGKLSVDFDTLVRMLTWMGVVYIFSALAQLAQGLISAKISQTTVYMLRKDLFEKISHLPIAYLDSHQHGDIMSRMTNDVDNVSNTISSSISSLFSSVLTLVGAFVLMVAKSWKMALIAMVTIPLTLLVYAVLSRAMRKYFVQRQKILGDLNGQIEEMVSGYKTVMAYGREPAACERFTKTSEEFRRCSIRANVWGGIMGPCNNIINNLNYLIIAAFGGYFSIRGQISIGDIQAILSYSRQFTQPINMIASQYAQILTAVAGAERVFAILDTPNETDRGEVHLDPSSIRGAIEFNDICFAYTEGKPVLKHLNLRVEPGQKIAIVGATGSGKTTIVNLLTRFYDVDSGEILLDGVSVQDIPKKELRGAIGIVLQDTVLFSDTIDRNIRYGKLDATDEEIRHAAAVSHSDSFIERLPDGYGTLLSESGSNLSQGQRQLLAISRAVLADPKILILDEATSSVDTRTEMHIQQALVALMQNRTSLIIAHRLSTIRDADVIVVIKNGTVAEAGSHEELLEQKGEYYTLYQNQFAGFAT